MVGSPPDSQAAIASSVAIETPPGRVAKAWRRSRRSSARRSTAIRRLTTLIVRWKWATDGAIFEMLSGFAFEMPIDTSPGAAASAAAGNAIAMARAGIRYVRFVSKRGTVAVSPPGLRDLGHTYPTKVCRMKKAWQADFEQRDP